MHRRLTHTLCLLSTIALVSCSLPWTRSGGSSGMQEEVVPPRPVSYEGRVQSAGVGASGTHRLFLTQGGSVLLQSDFVDLSNFVDRLAKIGGLEEQIPGEGSLVHVTTATMVEEAATPVLEDEIPSSSSSSLSSSSSSSSSSSLSSISSVAVSSVAASSSKASVAPPPAAPVSSSSAAASVSGNDERAAAMAKSKMGAENFTQVYCKDIAGFCVKYHRNWYHHSFGAQSPALWYVEVGAGEIERLGDGPISIRLLNGDMPAGSSDGMVIVQGDRVIGYRAWTGDRHFEVTAPVLLREAVQVMTQSISVYEAASSSSSL